MTEKSTAQITEFLAVTQRMNYFTKLKTDNQNDNSFITDLKIFNYSELNQMIASLLRSGIKTLQDENSEAAIDVMYLLEMALKLLPNDEMELLDELYKIL